MKFSLLAFSLYIYITTMGSRITRINQGEKLEICYKKQFTC